MGMLGYWKVGTMGLNTVARLKAKGARQTKNRALTP